MTRIVNRQTGQVMELSEDGKYWQPVVTNPAGEVPEFLGGAAFGQASLNMLQRMGSRLGLNEAPDEAAMARLRELYPRAAMLGEMQPTLAGGPSRLLPQIAFSAGMGALSADDPRAGAAYGAGGAAVGSLVGQMAGRVARSIGRGMRSIGADDALPSGIRQTTGQRTGNEALRQAESSMARNPITAGPYQSMAAQNRELLTSRAINALGVQADNLPEAINKARTVSVRRMERAVPASARIEIPEEVMGKFRRLNRLTDELYDFPESNVVSGSEFRQLRSDVGDLTTSSKSTIRRNGREILEALDDAAMATDGVIPEMYAQGRAQYRVVKAFERGQAVNAAGEINAPTLRNNLRRAYGDRSDPLLGNQPTGYPAIDSLQQTLADYRAAGIVGADSGTPTGLSVPLLAGDLFTTGGAGTASMALGSRALQSGAGFGAASGLAQNAPEAARAGAVLGREAGQQLRRKRRKKDDDED